MLLSIGASAARSSSSMAIRTLPSFSTAAAPRFSDTLWSQLEQPLEKMHRHPFVAAVRDGSIDEATMRFYLEQDFLYLIHYGRAFKILSARVQGVEGSAAAERASKMLTACAAGLDPKKLGQDSKSAFALARLNWDALKDTEQAPYTRLYTDHLLKAATLDPYPSAITALLPCPLTYQRLFSDKDPADGSLPHVLSSSSASDSTKLCKAWVEHYGSPSYRAYVNKWCSIIDDVAAEASDAELAAMRREFDLATRMEYLFWDMAWERRSDWGLKVQRF